MLIIKKRNIQKGFSLIELMVAAAILAIAILGIFQAYNVSFMGMSDARDRTVATNYVREAMEGIKNMDFDKIITQSRSYITGSKYKYEREVIVQESTNIKKVTTKVYWRDRNGNKKIVENGMLVHFMQTSEGTATRIMLIANPYNVLPGGRGTSTIITAVIKDAKGNTVTIWTGDISFSIDSANSTSSGTFSDYSDVDNGISSIIFTASDNEGKVVIIASAEELTSDSVTIKISSEAVKIDLNAEPMFMTLGSSSLITAKIVDADGDTVTEATNVITFSVSGPGTLSAITSTAPTNGIAKITLTSNGTPGTITVTASATGLEPGVVNVFTGGKISLSASRFSVPVNETSEVTVTTKDINGVPIKYVGTINLSVEATQNSNGSGSLSIYTLDFDGSTSSNTITFTASSKGTIKISATDQAGILDEGSIELTITEALVPHHIAVTANPSIIKAGGTETSTITARVKTADNITVTSYEQHISFHTDLGIFPNNSTDIDTSDPQVHYENGIATVVLDPLETAGTATVTVCSPSAGDCQITGSTEVVFYIEADYIDLIADPQNIPAGGGEDGTCTITATIMDESGVIVPGYSGEVKFSIIENSQLAKLKGTNPAPVEEGVATIKLESGKEAGTVRIEATSSFINSEGVTTKIVGYLNISVITLELVKNSVKYFDNTVSFDIEVKGADLLLEKMKVSWSPNGTLYKIKIKESEVYSNGASSGTVIDINDITLSTEKSNVKIYFNQVMSEKTITVIFNTDSGNYSVKFKVPKK